MRDKIEIQQRKELSLFNSHPGNLKMCGVDDEEESNFNQLLNLQSKLFS